jgi:hypothetical protein
MSIPIARVAVRTGSEARASWVRSAVLVLGVFHQLLFFHRLEGLHGGSPHQRVNRIPMRDWLYGRLLVCQVLSMTIAPGGVGKPKRMTQLRHWPRAMRNT